jgi:hypothetical protein
MSTGKALKLTAEGLQISPFPGDFTWIPLAVQTSALKADLRQAKVGKVQDS